MKRCHTPVMILLLIGFVLTGYADEGMWMPHQMKLLSLETRGLQMNPGALYGLDGTGLMSAVVSLGGGTGEFVSAEGLILTNHHVAYGGLQRASTKEMDYLQNGFIAWTKEEEIPSPGSFADVLLGYENVTPRILPVLKPGLDARARYEAVERAVKELVASAEAEGSDRRAAVSSMYSGNEYYLFRFKRLRDIRIVYAPPQDLGNFGGEVDNWMWPRHTCDFTFLRAYVSPEGLGTEYSAENVPFQPKSVVKISLAGFREGDLTFIMGYPGRTYRNFTVSELKDHMDGLRKRIALYREIVDFYESSGRDNREIEIKYASKVRGLLNSLKNYQGKLEGMEKVGLLARKEKDEKEFKTWTETNPFAQKTYGAIVSRVDEFVKRNAVFEARSEVLNQLLSGYLGSTLLSQAHQIVRTAVERQKPDLEREPAFQERNLPYIRQNIELAERGYDLATDKAFLKFWLRKLLSLPPEQAPQALRELLAQNSVEAVEKFVDDLFGQTVLGAPARRLELIDKTPEELAGTGDPLLQLAAGLEEEMKTLREERKAYSQEHLELKKRYEAGRLDQNQGVLAPDANSTIRFTYGEIKGYRPRDGVLYLPQTTLGGVMEKDTGEEPFRVPEKLKKLRQDRDFGRYKDENLDDVPACFLNVTNVTGGNSGSPVFNAKGEQIGIVFDMTYESVTGDYLVIPELQRTISVDIRYVLFVTEKFSGAEHILRELGL